MIRTKTKKQKVPAYEAYLLGLALVGLLLGEYALITHTTSADWQAGLSVLDVSESVSQTVVDMKLAFEPAVNTTETIYNFYQQAAVAATPMFDFTADDNSNSMQFVDGVTQFYQVAANEMTDVLDLSNYASSSSPAVAGISISH